MDNVYEIYLQQAKLMHKDARSLERSYDKKIYATDKRHNRKI